MQKNNNQHKGYSIYKQKIVIKGLPMKNPSSPKIANVTLDEYILNSKRVTSLKGLISLQTRRTKRPIIEEVQTL